MRGELRYDAAGQRTEAEVKHSAVDSRSNRRRRGFSAWLAIVALLLEALLPAGFAVAAPADTPVIGFCGKGPAPGQNELPPAGAHCIYCLVAAVGPAPAAMPPLAAPQFVDVVALPPFRRRLVDRPAPFAAAQPRGPPVAT